jgi:uncharacterized protein
MFEWDIAKSAKNLRERGFDFVHAAKVFEQPTIEADDKRAGYGEQRVRAIGRVDDQVLFVVYTWRGTVRRIISARLANRKERNAYRAIYD